jgi:membrane-associated phospholipid phosphatase
MALARQASPGTLRGAGMAAVAAGFGVLAGLVVSGTFTRLDQYAVDHWMLALSSNPEQPTPTINLGLIRPFSWHIPWWHKLLGLLTYPASVLISGLAFVTIAWLLRRRGQTVAAVVWVAAWIVGNAVEVLGKGGLDRPELFKDGSRGSRLHITNFDSSFPSGHTMRAVLVAWLLGYAWRRAAPLAALWTALVPFALVVSGDHTPTDVAGGLLVGLFFALAAEAVLASRLVRSRSWKAALRS